MCCEAGSIMASPPSQKPLNPEAQPFSVNKHFLLPHEFYHCQTRHELAPTAAVPVFSFYPGLVCKQPVSGCFYLQYCQPRPFVAEVQAQPASVYACNAASYGGGSEPEKVEIEQLKKRGGGGAYGRRVTRTRVRRQRMGMGMTFDCSRRISGLRVWREKIEGGGRVHSPLSAVAEAPPSPTHSHCQFSDDASLCGKTTIMIKNIPNKFRRNMLLDFLDRHCQEQNEKANLRSDPFHVVYDFVYLPMDFRTGDNLGYAFVNFTCPTAALKMSEILNQFRWGVFGTTSKVHESKKICEITWARIQGKDELLRHFKNSIFRCHNMEYLPVVLSPPRDGSTASQVVATTIGKCLISVLK